MVVVVVIGIYRRRRTACATGPRGNELLIYCRKTDHYYCTRATETATANRRRQVHVMLWCLPPPVRCRRSLSANIANSSKYIYILYIFYTYISFLFFFIIQRTSLIDSEKRATVIIYYIPMNVLKFIFFTSKTVILWRVSYAMQCPLYSTDLRGVYHRAHLPIYYFINA